MAKSLSATKAPRVVMASMLIATTIVVGSPFVTQLRTEQNCAWAAEETSNEGKANLYIMGKSLCKAVILLERNATQDKVNKEYGTAQKLAKEFELNLPALPQRAPNPKKQVDWATKYILQDLNDAYKELEKEHSRNDSLIFQSGCKAGLLRMLYHPGEQCSMLIGKILERNGQDAISSEAWKPLTDAIKAKKSKDVVMKALDDMDELASDPKTYQRKEKAKTDD